MVMANHPQLAGGSHLPDITVITPVFNEGKVVFFVASRGHHADIGGISPGSMPPHSHLLVEEGVAVVSYKLVSHGRSGLMLGGGGPMRLVELPLELRVSTAFHHPGLGVLGDPSAEPITRAACSDNVAESSGCLGMTLRLPARLLACLLYRA